MNKIVYNVCYGGFGLSDEAKKLYSKLSGKGFSEWSTLRHCQFLVQVVETLGCDANGFCANLEIYETEANKYRIDEYDGIESVITEDEQEWVVIK